MLTLKEEILEFCDRMGVDKAKVCSDLIDKVKSLNFSQEMESSLILNIKKDFIEVLN